MGKHGWARNTLERLGLYTLLVVAYTIVSVKLESIGVIPLASRDEDLYIEAGLKYINGTPPIDYNMEHPPLAKYIIGICHSTGLGDLCPRIAVATSVILASKSLSNLGFKKASKWIYLALLDPLLYSLSLHDLLDTYMLPASMLTLYTYTLKTREPLKTILLGASSGIALAMKHPALLIVAPIQALHIRNTKSIKTALLLLTITLAAYTATYIQDARTYGPEAIIKHNIEALEYMKGRHGFSPIILANGILEYILRIELWGKTHIITINITFTNHTLANYTINTTKLEEPELVINYTPWLANLALVTVPAVTIHTLTSKKPEHKNLKELSIITLATHLHLAFGPLWWYYTLPVAAGYILLLAYLEQRDARLYGYIILSQALTWIIYIILNIK